MVYLGHTWGILGIYLRYTWGILGVYLEYLLIFFRSVLNSWSGIELVELVINKTSQGRKSVLEKNNLLAQIQL